MSTLKRIYIGLILCAVAALLPRTAALAEETPGNTSTGARQARAEATGQHDPRRILGALFMSLTSNMQSQAIETTSTASAVRSSDVPHRVSRQRSTFIGETPKSHSSRLLDAKHRPSVSTAAAEPRVG
jgi:hypothetical protein